MKIFRLPVVGFALFLLIIVLAADLELASELFRLVYIIPYGDKVGHFFLMGTMSMIANIAFPIVRLTPLKVSRTSLVLFAIITVEELTQLFFTSRTFSMVDLSANLAGIWLLGEVGVWICKQINIKKERDAQVRASLSPFLGEISGAGIKPNIQTGRRP